MMRVDSCRKCGTELDLKQKCSVCQNSIMLQCKNCHIETDEQIHLECRLSEMNCNTKYGSYAIASNSV